MNVMYVSTRFIASLLLFLLLLFVSRCFCKDSIAMADQSSPAAAAAAAAAPSSPAKRRKKAEKPPRSDQCAFFMERKRRRCNMQIAAGGPFCAVHAEGVEGQVPRVPCPLDPSQ